MNILQSIILGLIQGITEFLPISSSGHLIIARDVLHIPLSNSLAFDVFLNTATLLAVIYCFWGDLKRLVVDFFTEGFSTRSMTLIWAIIIGTIPAGVVGLLYGDKIESAFRAPHAVAWALIIVAVVMYFADIVSTSRADKGGISILKGFIIGVFQTFALIPGVSRSGASISGGLFSKLSREEAIRFSFLLYIPVSAGALLKTMLDVHKAGIPLSSFADISHLIAFFFALVSGIWAVKFMVSYLAKHKFTPFIIYRIILALLIFILL